MPKPYPKEFREDVVRVTRERPAGVTLEQIAADFGIHAMTLSKWLRQADIDEGARRGVSRGPRAPICERRTGGSSCWNRRTRCCVGPPPTCPRRTCREKALPARERARR